MTKAQTTHAKKTRAQDIDTEIANSQKKFGLPTALAMVIGICVGSGIFFRADNVLQATNGNVWLGVCIFLLGALSIIFGSLTFATLAAKTDEAGGIVAYAQHCFGEKFACVVGWFMSFIYLPTCIVIVGWVAGLYICTFFGWNQNFETCMCVGFALISLIVAWNSFLTRFAAAFQNVITVVKMIPFVLIIGMGCMSLSANPTQAIVTNPQIPTGWLAAVAPVAFALDGWICAGSIAPELKNPKKILPLALSLSPVVVVVVYIGYFLGSCIVLGPQTIMQMGDTYVFKLFEPIFGPAGSRISVLIILIAMVGSLNGLIMTALRAPLAQALRGDLPKSKWFAKISTTWRTPLRCCLLEYIVMALWMLIHWQVSARNLLGADDVSELAVAMLYVLFIPFYIQVIRMWKATREDSMFMGLICPIGALAGAFFIILGCLTHISHVICLASYGVLLVLVGIYAHRKESKTQNLCA